MASNSAVSKYAAMLSGSAATLASWLQCVNLRRWYAFPIRTTDFIFPFMDCAAAIKKDKIHLIGGQSPVSVAAFSCRAYALYVTPDHLVWSKLNCSKAKNIKQRIEQRAKWHDGRENALYRQFWSQFGVMEDRVLTKIWQTNQLIALHSPICILSWFMTTPTALKAGTVDGELSGHLLLYMNCHMERRERWIL